MSVFERSVTGFRHVQTHYGDDLQALALRELGDPNRWHEIAWLNNLIPPYLTDDPARSNDRVLLTGSTILIPAPPRPYSGSLDVNEVFLRDCVLVDGFLREDGDGDIGIVAGRENLKQQLRHRVTTPLADLRRHPDYGCGVSRILGVVNGPTAGQLGADYVKTALRSDFRVASVTRTEADIAGDVVRISAEVETIAGGDPVDISSSGQWNPYPWDQVPEPEVPDPGHGGWGENWGDNFGG